MKYRFHPEAEAELNDAVDYYDACKRVLGWNSREKSTSP